MEKVTELLFMGHDDDPVSHFQICGILVNNIQGRLGNGTNCINCLLVHM